MNNTTHTEEEMVLSTGERLPALLCTLLERRGLTNPVDVERFLYPDYERDTHDPHLLKDITKAADRIWEAIEKGETIRIFSDYDVDGISSAAIMHEFFRTVECPVGVYMPDRNEEGYGLNKEAVDTFIADGVDLMITLDCGITSHSEIARATDAGMDVIVVDHHQIIDELPPAYAVIDPHRADDEYPFTGLCGGALAFKLVQVLIADHRMGQQWSAGQEKWLLDLVALSLVADMMPMQGENRALVRYGLFVLAQTKRPGLRELFSVARVEPRARAEDLTTNITESVIAYTLGPRINAASRMAHAGLAFDLLTTTSSNAARSLAFELEEHNRERRRSVSEVEKELYGRVSSYTSIPPFIIEYADEWSVSLLGLVAGRLAERYGVPVLLATAGPGEVAKASLRAPAGYSLIHALEHARDLLVQYGGHEAAAGCSFACDNLEDLRECLQEHARVHGGQENTKKEEYISISPKDVTLESAEFLEKMAPFGEGNPRPLFILEGVELTGVDMLGKKNNHAKLYFTRSDGGSVSALFFFHNGEADALKVGECYNVTGELSINEWKGRRSPQFKLRNIEKA